jgi:hypothetical protein
VELNEDEMGGVKISIGALQKIQFWTDMASGEVSGMGLVKSVNGTLEVSDVFLVKQDSSGGTTELDQLALAELIQELEMQGIDSSQLKFWWHSHCDMGVFWSGTDDECIEALAPAGWVLAMVVNKKGRYKLRLRTHIPFTMDIDDLTYTPITPNVDGVNTSKWKAEFKSKVKESVGFVKGVVRYAGFGTTNHFEDYDPEDLGIGHYPIIPNEKGKKHGKKKKHHSTT